MNADEKLNKLLNELRERTLLDCPGCEVDISNCIEKNTRDMCNDFTVDLSLLPKGVTHIRFTNSY